MDLLPCSGHPTFDRLIERYGIQTPTARQFLWDNALKGLEDRLAATLARIEREARVGQVGPPTRAEEMAAILNAEDNAE